MADTDIRVSASLFDSTVPIGNRPERIMSDDDVFLGLLHAMRHGDKIVEELMQGVQGTPFAQVAQSGLLDRDTVSDRRFWTGAALGAAAVLAVAATQSRRKKTAQPNAVARKKNGHY